MSTASLYRRFLPSPPAIDFASVEGKVCVLLTIANIFFFFFELTVTMRRRNRLFILRSELCELAKHQKKFIFLFAKRKKKRVNWLWGGVDWERAFITVWPSLSLKISTLMQKIFNEALQKGTMEGFFRLISYFQTQSEPAYCGLASLSMVLNSLSIDPGRKWKGIYTSNSWLYNTTFGCGVSWFFVSFSNRALEVVWWVNAGMLRAAWDSEG